MNFVCASCGKTHDGLLRDYAWKLPDIVWAIPPEQRQGAAKFTNDLCQYGERYFIRCVLPVPLIGTDDSFNWGVWAEVDWPTFERYLEIYEVDAQSEPCRIGKIANAIPGYPEIEESVEIHFGSSSARPSLRFSAGSVHALATEQRQGIDGARHHELLESIGANET
jgi:hypothetical protein